MHLGKIRPLFKIRDYTFAGLAKLLNGKREISQEQNLNAYTRLFIVNEKTVIKIYTSSPELAKQNVDNLLLMRRRDDLASIKELVMPTSLIRVHGKIVGYSMPYIFGCSLYQLLEAEKVSDKVKLSAFNQLADVIRTMPEDVSIGDLHGENVMVDADNRIHLIDIDGFSLRDGHSLTMPHCSCFPNIIGKYNTPDGTAIVSKDSDIFCFFHLLLTWLSGSELSMSNYSRQQYFKYLSDIIQNMDLLVDIEALNSPSPNTLGGYRLSEILSDKEALKYETFLRRTGLILEEEKAAKVLETYL